jgi:cytochrome b subunit of formate dehydrogenase
MSEIAQLPLPVIPYPEVLDRPRHSVFVRVTHGITALSFLGLPASGMPILLAHPRLYWGETGSLATPSFTDLPLPFVLEIPMRGPGRYLHFFFAWVCVLTALVCVAVRRDLRKTQAAE